MCGLEAMKAASLKPTVADRNKLQKAMALIEHGVKMVFLLCCLWVELSGCTASTATTIQRDTFMDRPPVPRSEWVLEEQ
jgi:hypothetical protein